MEYYTEIFVWGSDHFGQLGLGSKQHKTYNIPKSCSFNILIKSISCGDQHSGFISSSNHIYTMGSNIEGRLGISDPSIKFSASPNLVSSLKHLECGQISCGGGHSLAITIDGAIYSWGCGDSGALGLGSTQSQFAPVAVRLPAGIRAVQGSCGSKHSALLTKGLNGVPGVFLCGSGDSGQLGTGKREKETQFIQIQSPEIIIQASCGFFHSGFVGVSGKIYMTGGNSFGQLGLGHKKGSCVLRKVEALEDAKVKKIECSGHSAALTDNGDVYVWGTGNFGEHILPYKIASHAKDLGVGGNFTVFVNDSNEVYSWGNNLNGELGLGDFDMRSGPTKIQSLQGKRISSLACGNNFAIALGEDLKAQSQKMKNPVSYRQSLKHEQESFKITLHESPKVANSDYYHEKFNSFRMKSKRSSERESIEKYPHLSDSRKEELQDYKKSLDSVMVELSAFKAENSRLIEEIGREQEKSKTLRYENDELLRINENLEQSTSSLQQEALFYQSQNIETQRLKMLLEESRRQIYSLEIENSSIKDEIARLVDLLKQQEQDLKNSFNENLINQEKALQESHHKKYRVIENELDNAKSQLTHLESTLTLTTSHSARLESALVESSDQVKELFTQIDELKSSIAKLKLEKAKFQQSFDESVKENEELKQKTLEKESQRDHMVKLIEEKIQELEEDRSRLINERDSLNRVVGDLTAEVSRLNTKLGELTHNTVSLEQSLLEEKEKSEKLMIDFETAKEEVVILELKNTEIFETLQKELSQRAKEYKERAISLLNTPSRAVNRSTIEFTSTYQKSPEKFETVARSPAKENKFEDFSLTQSVEPIGKTPQRSRTITRTQQEKIAAAAMSKLQNHGSPLKDIRISSPSRRSPDRPSPFNRYIKSTPEVKPRGIYNL